MKVYEYCVYSRNNIKDFIFVNASCRKIAINRGWKEWFKRKLYFHFNKKDIRALRVSK